MSGKDVIHQQRELTSTIAEPWEVVTAEEYSGSYQLKGHELDTMYRSEDIGKRVLPSGGGGAPQRLTMRLIAECTGAAANTSTTERSDQLLQTEILRLDWRGISGIENLDSFTQVRELYLQHNRIRIIEELDTLTRLEFLALGSNHIRCLENLTHLTKLQVLDVSYNEIEDADTQELPPGLVILNLTGNPCCLKHDFDHKIASTLPNLMKVKWFCAENSLCGTEAQTTLKKHMERAVAGSSTSRAYVPLGRRAQQPESTDDQPGRDLGQERMDAFVNLQEIRARAIEQSINSIDQPKYRIRSSTRQLMERKMAAAHDRSVALEDDTRKVLEVARSEARARQEKMSEDTKQFNVDMRHKISAALAKRRHESEKAQKAAAFIRPTSHDEADSSAP